MHLLKEYSYFVAMFLILLTISIYLTFKVGSPNDFLQVIVEDGDTLWGLAEEYKDHHDLPHYAFVEWVSKENNLRSTTIFPGEQLTLPIKASAVADSK